ncbi:MAG: non-homologous end-joining DNA ligase, partial [Candidatus Baltobacteraceae bacterium]
KGPSRDPAERRLAMHVEDHPFDYRDFEGIIPKGNYGAGEVVVWDRGWYAPLETGDPAASVAGGKLKFVLHGKKLNGMFTLIRIKNREESGDPWLLIKDHDEYVDATWDVTDAPESVKSGKTLTDFANDPRAPHWTSSKRVAPRVTAPENRIEPMPRVEHPMLASLTDQPFDDPDWLFEIKWDGYRALAEIAKDGTVTLTSRNGKDFLVKFPELAGLAAGFSERPLIVDGEIAVLDEAGRSSFQSLQERLDRFGRTHRSEAPITFVAFDLPYGNGRDLRREPLEARKAALEAIVRDGRGVLFSKHVVGEGKTLFAFARERGLEGIVAKRRASKYVERRSKDWLKIKAVQRTECVIGGWTEGRGSRKGFGALLVGVYDGEELVSAGSVGTGFDAKLLASIAARLAPLERKTSPFKTPPKTDAPAHWVRPELVAEIAFGEWTRDGQLRHPVFVALRIDKDPKDVVRERVTRH